MEIKGPAIVILLLFLFCLPLYSVSLDDIKEKMDLSGAAIKDLTSAFQGVALKGSFTQTKSISGSNRKLKSSGTVSFVPGYGIIWYTEKPYASMLVVGRDVLIQKVRESNPVHLSIEENAIYRQIATALESSFSGDFSTAGLYFDTYFLQDGETWHIKLIPNDSTIASFMSSIHMEGRKMLEALTMMEANGDSISYEFSDLRQNGSVEDEISKFYI